MLAAVIVVGMISFICIQAWPSLQALGFRLFTDPGWAPTNGQFNAVPMIFGTALTSISALVIATPLAWTLASVQAFYLKRNIYMATELIIDLLAGIPSVVLGFWGLSSLVPLLYYLAPPGASLLAGILILTIMIVPTMTTMFRKLMETSPRDQIEASMALGLSRRTLIWKVLLPAQRSSIISISLLGLGRAFGETIAVLMVIGNIPQIPSHLLAPVRTLTSNIALEMAYALDQHRSVLFANALFLILCVALFLFAAKINHMAERRYHG